MKINALYSSSVLACALSLALNSCYFNSAGFITDAASHRALMDTSELKTGQVVYTDGTRYYLEIPHNRFDTPVRLQYKPFLDKLNRDFYNTHATYDDSVKRTRKSGSVMVEIPADFGRYLTGESTTPFNISGTIRMAEDPDLVKTYSTKPIVNLAGAQQVIYDYISPNSGWLYTGAVFDWLLVDLPVTLTENALMFVTFWIVMLDQLGKNMENYNASGGSSYGENWQEKLDQNMYEQQLQNQAVWDEQRRRGEIP